MTLSIVVITMNRADQLRSALLSCVYSKLPVDTEFVIVDNASTDNTELVVKEFFSEQPYSYNYEKEEVNKGVGGGRNRGFEMAHGDFLYFLDDDAVISSDSYDTFFELPIKLFRKDDSIASITTRIYDEMLKCDRDVRYSKHSVDSSVPDIFMYLGGSHFLRKACYCSPLYLDFKYGMEELLPCLYVLDRGFRNCYLHQIKILHQPKYNKWESGDDKMSHINVLYNVNCYVSKKLIYPMIYRPVLFSAFICRTLSRFGLNKKMWDDTINTLKQIKMQLPTHARKIKNKTIFTIINDYSFGAAF